MVLALNNVAKAFGTDVILQNISFNVEDKEKLAIIGVNGAGKSTLFKIITGELALDSGDVIIPKDVTIGYFSQNLEIDSSNTIYGELLTVFEKLLALEENIRTLEQKMGSASGDELEALMSRYSALSLEFEKQEGYQYKSRLRGVIKGLGFSDSEFYQPIHELSGGQKTRVALGKLLLSSPDLLLLDEPTNHLDIDSIQWLEDFLRSYQGSVIIISHDRYFLDKIVTRVIEIENKKSTVYHGNYTYYASKKEIDRDIALKHYMSQQKEIAKQEEAIKKLRSFNREKSIKRAESKEKMLNKIERLDAPDSLPDKMRLRIKPQKESGFDVLTVSDLKKGFDGQTLFEHITFDIKKGEKVALIGPNGIGKTTLFRIILDKLEQDFGTHALGSSVIIGYYDQEHATLNEQNTIFDEISLAYPKLTNLEIRNVLASFVFTGDDVLKSISALSGGEKGRVALAKIMLSNANFLILDEPTNHLDLNSKEILESTLQNYEGTVLYISHDRYFINNTAEKIIELTPSTANIYLGNYDYYLEKKTAEKSEIIASPDTSTEAVSDNKVSWQKQKEEQANQRKREAAIKKLEADIEACEARIAEADISLATPDIYTDPHKSKEIFDQKTQDEELLIELYAQWEELQ